MYPDNSELSPHVKWFGGETQAMQSLHIRLMIEEEAFRSGYYLPNQANPDVLQQPTSMSAHLRYGCLSVRLFYWRVHEVYKSVQEEYYRKYPSGPHITGQLIWREYFYTMSVNNLKYGQMVDNDICLEIQWAQPDIDVIEKWKNGKTGFPLIDAAMRQLLAEGWLHHTLRNVVASFLTRGALWQNWEFGLQHFLKYLLDADWSVCAGNWMWVSSSAFERLLDTSACTCPIALAKKMDPNGDYVKRYIPELTPLPIKYM